MSPLSPFERDQLHQQIGEHEERVKKLEHQIARQRELWESDAREWQRLQRHQCELAEWLVDAATNEHGRLTKPTIDAGLGGEAFVPCTITVTMNERQYRLTLTSTCYDVEET